MNATATLIVVDDDASIRDAIADHLLLHGYRVRVAADAAAMDVLLQVERPDAIILDWMMPGEDGLSVCRRLQSRAIPILMLSAMGSAPDRVIGLEMGADDYLAKPFDPRELLARVRAVLRRYRVQATLPERDASRRAFRFAGWELNLRTRRLVAPDGEAVELSNGEFSLLNALCRAPQRVLTRDQLLSMSRLHEAEVYDRTVDVQVRRLRMKMEADPAHPLLILTERGAGYRLACDVETLY